MKEHPILFSTPMVRAILEGRKTQTMRVIKPQPKWVDGKNDLHYDGGSTFIAHSPVQVDEYGDIDFYGESVKCPYGQPGDILWVRETWNDDWCDHVLYKANGGLAKEAGYSKEPRWRPSIHMPRKYARIFFEITNIRIERVQEISENDCQMEGLKLLQEGIKSEFAVLWDSINEKRGFGWDINPWVWVIKFKRIKIKAGG